MELLAKAEISKKKIDKNGLKLSKIQGLGRTEDTFEVNTVKISEISRQNKFWTNKLLKIEPVVYIAASNGRFQKKYHRSVGWQL